MPIYYSRRDDRSHPTYRDAWNQKLQDPDAFQYARDPRADQWPESYGPRAEDRLIICGVSTPGCVRSGAVDAFSHNFRSIIVADACGDCSPQAHKANLFDLDMKFGDVETLTDTIADLKKRYAWCLTQVLLSPAWQAKRALKPLKHSATQKHNSD